MINAVIIDDEEISRKTLKNLISEYFSEITVVGMAASVQEGIAKINQHHPDLVFLDIAMPDGDGFEVIEKTMGIPYQTIFITAHHDYAIKAFEFAALHYLLKPINIEELEHAIARFRDVKIKEAFTQRFEILKQGFNNSFKKIALPTNDSILFIELASIIRCEASHNYTVFHLKNKEHVVMSKSLFNYENLLEPFNFFRVHDKHLINMKYVTKYIRGKGGSAIMEDGSEIEISTRKKEDFLRKISEIMHTI